MRDGQRCGVLGRYQKNCKNGCENVIHGADRDRWIAVSKIVAPLDASSALSARIAKVSILADVLDSIFRSKFCIENIDLFIDETIKRQTSTKLIVKDSGFWMWSWATCCCVCLLFPLGRFCASAERRNGVLRSQKSPSGCCGKCFQHGLTMIQRDGWTKNCPETQSLRLDDWTELTSTSRSGRVVNTKLSRN